MTVSARFPDRVLQHRRLLPLDSDVARALHRWSLIWAAIVIVLLEVARRGRWLDHLPGADSAGMTARPVFVGLFLAGAILAWRWAIVGGVVAAFTASAVAVWEFQVLEFRDALAVVLAFAVPGAMWVVLDLHDQRPARAVAGLVAVAVAVTSGGVVAAEMHDRFLGPTHPESIATIDADLATDWLWVGAVTPTSAVITAKLDAPAPDPVLVVEGSDGTRSRVVGSTDEHDVSRLELTGLSPATDYQVALGDPNGLSGGGGPEATFRTFPEGPADFTIALGSCSRVGSNGAVFDAIRALEPELFVIDGDFYYANIDRNEPGLFREVLDLTLSRPGQSALYRTTPVAYVWDDHDYAGNNADRTAVTRPAVMEVYREYVPHYPLADDGSPIYQAFDIGRVRVIVTDTRADRSPASDPDGPDKTMLGDEQQAWLEQQLLAADDTSPLIIWVNPVPWIGSAEEGADGWAGYSTERAELANFITEHEIDGILVLSGDAHMVAIDDGGNTGYTSGGGDGFPLLHAGALDRPGHMKGGPYSEGALPGSGQFGTVEVDDLGDRLHVRLAGRDWEGNELLAYEFDVTVPG